MLSHLTYINRRSIRFMQALHKRKIVIQFNEPIHICLHRLDHRGRKDTFPAGLSKCFQRNEGVSQLMTEGDSQISQNSTTISAFSNCYVVNFGACFLPKCPSPTRFSH